MTARCKKIARENGLTVFIVSTSNDLRKGLSRETHRVGYHFPSITVEQACMSLGVSLTASGRVLESNFALLDEEIGRDELQNGRATQRKRKSGGRQEARTFDLSLSQAVIDTQAREAIKDLFPKIPSEDLHEIVGRSFQKVFSDLEGGLQKSCLIIKAIYS